MSTIASIVLILLMCSVFVIPFVRIAERKPPPTARELLPKVYDLRPLDEKVEEYVRIQRAATQIERQQRKTARELDHKAWLKNWVALNRKED